MSDLEFVAVDHFSLGGIAVDRKNRRSWVSTDRKHSRIDFAAIMDRSQSIRDSMVALGTPEELWGLADQEVRADWELVMVTKTTPQARKIREVPAAERMDH